MLCALLLALQCTTTTPNSVGAGAVLSAPLGGSSWSVTGLPPGTFGGLFVSIPNANTAPGVPFAQGTLCIAAPYRVEFVQGTGQGVVTGAVPPGWVAQGWQYIQFWYRDGGRTISSNTWKWN
jgi:hypothetical protein